MMMKQAFPRRWDWYSAVLLAAIVYVSTARLSITDWTRELGYVESIAVWGIILGLALGMSRSERRSAGWLMGGCTIAMLAWQMMMASTEKVNALERLAGSAERLALAFGRLAGGKPVADPIFLVVLLSLLYWSIGVYCAYRLIRGARLLDILIPPTIPILVVQYYDSYEADRIWIIAFYFFLVLLLIGRVNIIRDRETWETERVFAGAEAESDVGKSILIMAIMLVMVAWLFPTPSATLPAAARVWQEINKPFETTHQWFNETLNALRTGSGSDTALYGDELGLGLSTSQGIQVVFSAAPPPMDFPRYYWQMRVYDTYENGSWSNSQHWSKAFSPGEGDSPVPPGGVAQIKKFSFYWQGSRSILPALPSQSVWVSRAGSIEYGDAGPGQIDILSWHTDSYIQQGEQYQARAVLLNPSIAQLQNAGMDYPAWVTNRYLQMPEHFPQEVRALAKDLTGSRPTPYDKASAITDYLRTAIKYSPSIPSAPPHVEPLEWFLFTWKSGYCNYYASAEVMLLRSIGVPARLAVGYAQGEANGDGTFTVRERDAHAWPQVYFPNIGWVDFEPTASQPALVRSSEPASPLPEAQIATPPPKGPSETQGYQNDNIIAKYQTIRVWVIILVGLAGCALWVLNRNKPFGRRLPQFVYRLYQRYRLDVPAWLKRWERWSETGTVERSFHAINQSLAWLGKPQPAYTSAVERAGLLKKILPSLAEDIDILIEQHELTLFSPTPGDALKAERAAWRIRYLTICAIVQRRLIVGAKDE